MWAHTNCTGNCNQGRTCTCTRPMPAEAVTEVGHDETEPPTYGRVMLVLVTVSVACVGAFYLLLTLSKAIP